MHSNSKKYLVINELRETVVIKRTRLLFRKVYCPDCGSETGLFECDGSAGEPKLHHLICDEHRGDTHTIKII
jgi:hypothetical protein